MPPSTAIQTGPQDIYSRGLECDRLFSVFLKTPRTHSRQISEYYDQFLSWAGFLGVFAAESASLDRRLKNDVDIKDLVLSMLRVLERNLLHGTQFEPKYFCV